MSEIKSFNPFLVRAIHEWILHNNRVPYITVIPNEDTIIPKHLIDGDTPVTFNCSYEAMDGLIMDNETVSGAATFGGVHSTLVLPISSIICMSSSDKQILINIDQSEGSTIEDIESDNKVSPSKKTTTRPALSVVK